jgi:hypothetical protein
LTVKAIKSCRKHIALFGFLAAVFLIPASGQEADYALIEADTLNLDSLAVEHSPRKAAMYSTVLPGLGQIYNKKYWKLPLVYGGLAGFGYAAIWNGQEYNYYFDLYKYMNENDLEEFEGRTFREVEWYKNMHLRYKNLMIILTIGFYALQIIDANVDAHLFDYDISDDISFTVDPVMADPVLLGSVRPDPGALLSSFGLRCCLNF